MIASIYKIENKINGKCYIGFSSNSPEVRWKKHITGGSHCLAINSAISLHGKDNFTFEIICQSKDAQHLLTEMEPYFIEKYNSFGIHGYNLTKGGEGVLGHKHSEESKNLIREKRAEQIFNEETIQKFKEINKKGTESYIRRYTDKTRAKQSTNQSKRMKEGYNPKATKWIVRDNKNQLQEVLLPTQYFGASFKSFWESYKKGKSIVKGNYKGWQLLEIIRL